MTTLGILILLIAIGLLVADPILERLTINNSKPIDLIQNNRKWILYSLIAIGGILFLNPFVNNNDGERTYVLNKWTGKEEILFDPGLHFVGWPTKTTSWPDVMSTVFDGDNGLVDIRFNDATQAKARANIRWELPRDEMSMTLLHKAYRSPQALQNRTLVPFGQECLAFAAQLMESETHYSGGQSQLKEYFRDQLLDGQYVLETKTDYIMDTLSGEQVKITKADIRQDPETGDAKRIPSDVQTYKIKAVFAAVPKVDYEEIVDKKLQAKIDQSTKESIAKQSLITAEQEALTADAEGRKLIAQTRAKYEAQKIQAVILAEQMKDVAQQEALQAKYVADKTEQEGRAEAAVAAAKVKAGLDPLTAAQIEKEIAIGVAKALAGPDGIQLPTTFIGGSQGNGQAIDPFTAVGLESLINISAKLGNKKK